VERTGIRGRRGRGRKPARAGDSGVAPEGGFVLLEVMLATVVLTMLFFGVGSVLTSQGSSVGSSSSWTVANGLLNQAMEEVHSLQWNVVSAGLYQSDSTLCGDTKISWSGPCPTGTATYNGESVLLQGGSATNAPFTPEHKTAQTMGGVTFTTAAYPTQYTGTSGISGIVRVTVIVTWSPSAIGTTSAISAQTLLYPPECIAPGPSNCVYPGPTQPFFYAGADSGGGSSVTVTGTVQDLPFDELTSIVSDVFSSMQIEQTSAVSGSVETSGAESQVDGTTQTVGENGDSTTANDEPGTGSGSQTDSEDSQSSTGISVTGTLDNYFELAPGDDSFSTTSTISASSSPTCTDLSGTTQVTGLPCGSGEASQTSATASDQLDLDYGGTVPLGVTPLSSIAPPNPGTSTAVAQSFVAHYTAAGPSTAYCDTGGTTSGDGCVHAGAERSLGTVMLGGIPSELESQAPSGWGSGTTGCPPGNYLVALQPYSDSVAAESGIDSTSTPSPSTAGAPSETVCYFNGSGYTEDTTTLPVDSNPQSIAPSLSMSGSLDGQSFTVTMASSLTLGYVTETTPASGCGSGSACQESATISSPLEGSITYDISAGTTQIAALTVSVNLGELNASTSYEEA
jgi:hypothetical protein